MIVSRRSLEFDLGCKVLSEIQSHQNEDAEEDEYEKIANEKIHGQSSIVGEPASPSTQPSKIDAKQVSTKQKISLDSLERYSGPPKASTKTSNNLVQQNRPRSSVPTRTDSRSSAAAASSSSQRPKSAARIPKASHRPSSSTTVTVPATGDNTFLTSVPVQKTLHRSASAAMTSSKRLNSASPHRRKSINHAVRYNVNTACVKLTDVCPHRLDFTVCPNYYCHEAYHGYELFQSLRKKCQQASEMVETADRLLMSRLDEKLEEQVEILKEKQAVELADLKRRVRKFNTTQQHLIRDFEAMSKHAHLLYSIDQAHSKQYAKKKKLQHQQKQQKEDEDDGSEELLTNEELFLQISGHSAEEYFFIKNQVETFRKSHVQHAKAILDHKHYEHTMAIKHLRQHGLALPLRFLNSLRTGYEDVIAFHSGKVDKMLHYLLQLTINPVHGGRDESILPSTADIFHMRRVKKISAELHSLFRIALGVLAKLGEEVRLIFSNVNREVEALLHHGKMLSVVPRTLGAESEGGAADNDVVNHSKKKSKKSRKSRKKSRKAGGAKLRKRDVSSRDEGSNNEEEDGEDEDEEEGEEDDDYEDENEYEQDEYVEVGESFERAEDWGVFAPADENADPDPPPRQRNASESESISEDIAENSLLQRSQTTLEQQRQQQVRSPSIMEYEEDFQDDSEQQQAQLQVQKQVGEQAEEQEQGNVPRSVFFHATTHQKSSSSSSDSRGNSRPQSAVASDRNLEIFSSRPSSSRQESRRRKKLIPPRLTKADMEIAQQKDNKFAAANLLKSILPTIGSGPEMSASSNNKTPSSPPKSSLRRQFSGLLHRNEEAFALSENGGSTDEGRLSWNPIRCFECRSRFRGDGIKQLPSLAGHDHVVRRRAADSLSRIDSLLTNFEKKVRLTMNMQVQMEKDLAQYLQEKSTQPAALVHHSDQQIFCSWTCLKRWSHHRYPPQFHYQHDMLIDLAAGAAVTV